MCMKNLSSNASSLKRMSFKVMSLKVMACMLMFSPTVTIAATDATNPSELPPGDYVNGKKRAAEAARRVIPRLKTEMHKTGVTVGSPVFIRAFKHERELEVWVYNKNTKKYQEFKRYYIHGMSGSLGPKVYEGDRQAVEGFYTVGKWSLNPQSRFHLSFNLGYPNKYDKAHKRTGHSLMIHGNRVSAGCLAMTDYNIEEIYTLCAKALENGQKSIQVHSFPFRMTAENMKLMRTAKWYGFWLNLKTGYDAFEKNKVPPVVTVRGKSYIFK